MVKASPLPRRRCVADRAILRESAGYVVRVLSPIVSADMTEDTFLGFALINPILMAVATSERRVAAHQRELCGS